MMEPKPLAMHPSYRTGRRIGLEGGKCELPKCLIGFITDKDADRFVLGYIDGNIQRCRFFWYIRHNVEAVPHAN